MLSFNWQGRGARTIGHKCNNKCSNKHAQATRESPGKTVQEYLAVTWLPLEALPGHWLSSRSNCAGDEDRGSGWLWTRR